MTASRVRWDVELDSASHRSRGTSPRSMRARRSLRSPTSTLPASASIRTLRDVPPAATEETFENRGERRAAIDAALRSQDWPRVYARLVALAFSRCRSRAQAEDLAQDAIRRALDPAHCDWNPEKEPSLLRFLGSIVNGLLRNERTSARARFDIPIDIGDGEGAVQTIADGRALADEAAAQRDLCVRRIESLRARLRTKTDSVALAIFELTLDGVETPLALSTELGLPVDEIVFARRRMHRAAAEVARGLHGSLEEKSS